MGVSKSNLFTEWQKEHPDAKAGITRSEWNPFKVVMTVGEKSIEREITLDELPSIKEDFAISAFLIRILNEMYEKVA